MKIATIEQFYPRRRMRLVKITTDTGIVGWGETTLEGNRKAHGRQWKNLPTILSVKTHYVLNITGSMSIVLLSSAAVIS